MLRRILVSRGISYLVKETTTKQKDLVNYHNIAIRCMSSFTNKFYWKPRKETANPKPKLSVILLEDIENFGRKFEVVKVKCGYARHVLIPEGKADYAIKENLEKYGCDKTDAIPRASLKFLKKLKNMHLIMQRPKDEDWEISKHHIALAFNTNFNLHVPVHCIWTSFESISEFGDYEVHVTVNRESTVPVKISVKEWEPVYKKDWKEILEGELDEVEEEPQV